MSSEAGAGVRDLRERCRVRGGSPRSPCSCASCDGGTGCWAGAPISAAWAAASSAAALRFCRYAWQWQLLHSLRGHEERRQAAAHSWARPQRDGDAECVVGCKEAQFDQAARGRAAPRIEYCSPQPPGLPCRTAPTCALFSAHCGRRCCGGSRTRCSPWPAWQRAGGAALVQQLPGLAAGCRPPPRRRTPCLHAGRPAPAMTGVVQPVGARAGLQTALSAQVEQPIHGGSAAARPRPGGASHRRPGDGAWLLAGRRVPNSALHSSARCTTMAALQRESTEPEQARWNGSSLRRGCSSSLWAARYVRRPAGSPLNAPAAPCDLGSHAALQLASSVHSCTTGNAPARFPVAMGHSRRRCRAVRLRGLRHLLGAQPGNSSAAACQPRLSTAPVLV